MAGKQDDRLVNPEVDVFEEYPELLVLEPVRKMIAGDRSRDKHLSKKIMKGIVLAYKKTSIMYNIPDKFEVIARTIIKKPEFNWKELDSIKGIDKIVELYKETQLTQAERSLLEWEEMMKKRDKFLKSQEYTLDHFVTNDDGDTVYGKNDRPILEKGTADQLDKMMSQTGKMYAELDKIKKDLSIEDAKKQTGKQEYMDDI